MIVCSRKLYLTKVPGGTRTCYSKSASTRAGTEPPPPPPPTRKPCSVVYLPQRYAAYFRRMAAQSRPPAGDSAGFRQRVGGTLRRYHPAFRFFATAESGHLD